MTLETKFLEPFRAMPRLRDQAGVWLQRFRDDFAQNRERGEMTDVTLVSSDGLKAEQKALTPDTKFYHSRQKKVMNKHARYNLCFAPEGQVAKYEEGLGTVVSYKDVPLLSKIREQLPNFVGEKAREL